MKGFAKGKEAREGKGREAKRNDERLYFKFMVKYFENKHKDLFAEAVTLYQHAKENNPNVRDLTKTVQFMECATPHIAIPRYYKSRQQQTKTVETTREPQMVLEIPLLNPQQTSSVLQTPTPPQAPVPVSQPLPSPPLLLPESIYQSLLDEIHLDPVLSRILDEMPYNDDSSPPQQDPHNDDLMNEFIWNDIKDTLPLEMEIA